MALTTGSRVIRNIPPEDWRIPDPDNFKNEIMIVLGNAPSMAEDLKAIYKIGLYDCPIMAINDAGKLYLNRIDHLASHHIEKMSEIRTFRRNTGLNVDFVAHSIGEYQDVDKVWPLEVSHGSSGLFGVITALKLGYNVVVAGISLTGNFGEYYGTEENSHPNKHKQYEMFRFTWFKIKPHLLDRVRAVSGYPCDLLGYPDGNWLLTS